MKLFKYISLFVVSAFFFGSCDKHVIEYEVASTGDAEFQLHYFEPIKPATADFYMYKVEINGQLVANSTSPLNSYNAIPSGAIGRYLTATPGEVNIKLYQSTNLNLVYDKNVTLKAGKQNVVIHDLNKTPIVFDTQYPFISDRKSYYTDTIGYVKFYNLLYESVGNPTTLTLQYQYQYILHPIYTEEDRDNGLIPEGKEVGNTTGDTKRSDWFNLGSPVAFGETTGWQEVPVKKSSFLAQGAANIYYRILVTSGGEVGVTMDDQGRLRARTTGTNFPLNTYSDYWGLTVGRRMHQFYSGIRSASPGSAVRQFTAN